MQHTDRSKPPSRDGLEPYQHWAWMWDEPLPPPRFDVPPEPVDPDRPGHWRVVGTGLVL